MTKSERAVIRAAMRWYDHCDTFYNHHINNLEPNIKRLFKSCISLKKSKRK